MTETYGMETPSRDRFPFVAGPGGLYGGRPCIGLGLFGMPIFLAVSS